LPLALYECGNLSLILRGKGLRVFENRELRKIFGYGEMKQQDAGENFMMRGFIILLYSSYSQDDQIKEDEMCVTHGRRDTCIQKFGCSYLRERTVCK
jgi:hypothetical protein